MARKSSPEPTRAASGPGVKVAAKDPLPGPVPMHRRLKMGDTDIEAGPYGQGRVSQVSSINSGGKRGW